MKKLTIELDHLPDGGKQYTGEIDGNIFGIDDSEVRSSGPLSYDLHIQRFEGELFLQGKISAPFHFQCVRCLDGFDKTIGIDNFSASLQIDNQQVIDITDTLREEIILVFPSYPHCGEADQEKTCQPDADHFRVDKQGQTGVNTPAPSSDSGVWDALDNLR